MLVDGVELQPALSPGALEEPQLNTNSPGGAVNHWMAAKFA